MTQQMSMSVTIFVSTTRRKVASTFAFSSAISVKRSSRSSHVGNPFAMASLAASCRPIVDKTLFRSESMGIMLLKVGLGECCTGWKFVSTSAQPGRELRQ
jgi:hypothetical protein